MYMMADHLCMHYGYDARMEFQQALKSCEVALKKFPGHESILALQAVALQRLNMREESLAVCNGLLSRDKIKQETLFHVEIALKALGEHHLVAKLYEKLSRSCPGNLEVQKKIFASYLAGGEIVKQQQVALKLYRDSGGKEELFLFWAVTSLVMQFELTNQKQFLVIARTMVEKHASNQGLTIPDSLMVYINILSALESWDTALRYLEEHGETLMRMEKDRKLLSISLMKDSGNLDQAAVSLEEILKEYPDDWALLLDLIDISLDRRCTVRTRELTSSKKVATAMLGNSMSPELPKSNIPYLEDVVQQLNHASLITPSLSTRAPQLGLCELILRSIVDQGKTEIESDRIGRRQLSDAVFDYWKRFGHLNSCYLDVAKYCRSLDKEASTELHKRMNDTVRSLSDTYSTKQKASYETSMMQISYSSGFIASLGAEEILVWAEEVMIKYKELVDLMGSRDLRSYDCVDCLPGLAAAALLRSSRMFITEHESKQALQCIILAILNLSIGVERAPYNANMQLSLCSLYGMLNCSELAEKAFKKLDIKHVQYESIAAHHLLPILICNCEKKSVNSCLKNLVDFHAEHDRDVGASMFMALEHGNFSKAIEFWNFSRRLKKSFNLAAARHEQAIIELRDSLEKMLWGGKYSFHNASVINELQKEGIYRFNDDLQTRMDWMPPPKCWNYACADLWSFFHDPSMEWNWWEDIESSTSSALCHRNDLVASLQTRQSFMRAVHTICDFNQTQDSDEKEVAGEEILTTISEAEVNNRHCERGTWDQTKMHIEEARRQCLNLGRNILNPQNTDCETISQISAMFKQHISAVFYSITEGISDNIRVHSHTLSIGLVFFSEDVLCMLAILQRCSIFLSENCHGRYEALESVRSLLDEVKTLLCSMKELDTDHLGRLQKTPESKTFFHTEGSMLPTPLDSKHYESICKIIIRGKCAALQELLHIVSIRLQQISRIQEILR